MCERREAETKRRERMNGQREAAVLGGFSPWCWKRACRSASSWAAYCSLFCWILCYCYCNSLAGFLSGVSILCSNLARFCVFFRHIAGVAWFAIRVSTMWQHILKAVWNTERSHPLSSQQAVYMSTNKPQTNHFSAARCITFSCFHWYWL